MELARVRRILFARRAGFLVQAIKISQSCHIAFADLKRINHLSFRVFRGYPESTVHGL
jgi:hypothetical protein